MVTLAFGVNGVSATTLAEKAFKSGQEIVQILKLENRTALVHIMIRRIVVQTQRASEIGAIGANVMLTALLQELCIEQEIVQMLRFKTEEIIVREHLTKHAAVMQLRYAQ